jgi:hypothetical protein
MVCDRHRFRRDTGSICLTEQEHAYRFKVYEDGLG